LFNSRKVRRPAGRAVGLVALAAAGLIGASTVASAATVGSPFVPRTFGAANSPSQNRTVSLPYACDFSGYGGPSAATSGQFNATLTLPRTAVAGDPAGVSFDTPAIPLPQVVTQKLASAGTFSLSLTGVTATEASGSAAKILEHPGGGGISTPPADIPVMTAVDGVTFGQAGTGHITAPTGFVITPSASSTAMAPIKCEARTATVTGYAVTVTAPPPPPTLPGPVYNCSFTIPGMPGGSGPFTAPLPMTISATGSRTTGSTDEVTLSSGAAGLGAAYPPGTTALAFSGSLPVTGAQQGSIPLRKYTTATSNTTFRVSGPLHLTSPGADHILYPNQFTFTISGPKNPVTGKPLAIVLSCQSKANTVGLTLKVTGKAAATGGNGGTAASGAVPAGAPNTGGGPRPGSDVPMAVGGAALLLIGAGFVVVAARRRRGQPAS
jgi:hypothetical protein